MNTRTTNAFIAASLSGILAVVIALFACPMASAYADDLADAQATLTTASQELGTITSEYHDLQSEISRLDKEINTMSSQVKDAQAAMLEGQEVLGDTVLSEYKSDTSLSLLNIFLTSTDVSDFVKNMTYYSSIKEDQAALIAEQKKLRDSFNDQLAELDAKRDAQQDKLDDAEAKKAEAEAVVSSAKQKVSSIKEARAQEALKKLQAQAAQLDKKEQSSSGKSNAKGWNTDNKRPATTVQDDKPTSDASSSASGGSSSKPNKADSGSDSSHASSNSSSGQVSKGWKTGVASAYGGKSDPNTPNPGTTANGSACHDSSMGVAIPMSWSHYKSYFGRAIEIRYGGKTVVATINDCGYMGGGARSLDLQPGVFKAFGYKTCQAWGLRTVSYRIL